MIPIMTHRVLKICFFVAINLVDLLQNYRFFSIKPQNNTLEK